MLESLILNTATPALNSLCSAYFFEIGSDLVPDYMTSVQDGGFYGWPFSYYGQHVDSLVNPQNPELDAKAIAPEYVLGPIPPHWA